MTNLLRIQWSKKFIYILTLLFLFVWALFSYHLFTARANVSITTSDKLISVNTIAWGTASWVTVLDAITITETNTWEISTGTIIVQLPTGFNVYNAAWNRITVEALDVDGGTDTSLRVDGSDADLIAASSTWIFTISITADSSTGNKAWKLVINWMRAQPTTTTLWAWNILVHTDSTSTITWLTKWTTALWTLTKTAWSVDHYIIRDTDASCTTSSTVATSCDSSGSFTWTVWTATWVLVIPVDAYGNVTTWSWVVNITASPKPDGSTISPTVANTAAWISEVSMTFDRATTLAWTGYVLNADDGDKTSTWNQAYAFTWFVSPATLGWTPNITPSTTEVAESWAYITVTFNTVNALPADWKIVLTMPSVWWVLSASGYYLDSIGGNTYFRSSTWANTITLTWDGSNDGIAASTSVSLTLTWITLPASDTAIWTWYTITTSDGNDNPIDSITWLDPAWDTLTGWVLTSVTVAVWTSTVWDDPGNITIDFELDHTLPQDGKIIYDFGESWTMPNDTDATGQIWTFVIDHNGGTDALIDESANISSAVISTGWLLTVTLDWSLTTAVRVPQGWHIRMIWNFTNDANPWAVSTASGAKVRMATQIADWSQRDYAAWAQPTYTTGAISSASVTTSPTAMSASWAHTFNFTTAHVIPNWGKIFFNFGTWFTIPTGATNTWYVTLTSWFTGVEVSSLATVQTTSWITVTLGWTWMLAWAKVLTITWMIIKNPSENVASDDTFFSGSEVDIITYNWSDELIDDLANPIYTTYTTAIPSIAVTSNTTTAVWTWNSVTVTFTEPTWVANDGKIVYVFWSWWTPKWDDADLEAGSAELTTFTVNAGDQTWNVVCALATRTVTCTFGGAWAPTAGQEVVMTLAKTVFRNPRSAVTSTTDQTLDAWEIDVYTTTAWDVTVTDLVNPEQDITFTANTLANKWFSVWSWSTAVSITNTWAYDAFYTWSITLKEMTPLTAWDKIQISFGTGWAINVVADCTADVMDNTDWTASSIDDDNSAVLISACASTASANASSWVLTMTLSWGVTIASGSVLDFRISAWEWNPVMTNPRSVNWTLNRIGIKIYDTNDKIIVDDSIVGSAITLTDQTVSSGSLNPLTNTWMDTPWYYTVEFVVPTPLQATDTMKLQFGTWFVIADTDSAADILWNTGSFEASKITVNWSGDITLASVATTYNSNSWKVIITLPDSIASGSTVSFRINRDLIYLNPVSQNIGRNTLDIDISDSDGMLISDLSAVLTPTIVGALLTSWDVVAWSGTAPDTSVWTAPTSTWYYFTFVTPTTLTWSDIINITFWTWMSLSWVTNCTNYVTSWTGIISRISDDGVSIPVSACSASWVTNTATITLSWGENVASWSVLTLWLSWSIIPANPRSVWADAWTNGVDISITDADGWAIAYVNNLAETYTAWTIATSYAVTVWNAVIAEAPNYYGFSFATTSAVVSWDKILLSFWWWFSLTSSWLTTYIHDGNDQTEAKVYNLTDAADVTVKSLVLSNSNRTALIELWWSIPASKTVTFRVASWALALNPTSNPSSAQTDDTTLDANEIDISVVDYANKVIDDLANPEWATYTAWLTAVSMEPGTLVQSTVTYLQVRFTLGSALPNDGKIVVDLPWTYAFNTSTSTIYDLENMDGEFSLSFSWTDVVTITRWTWSQVGASEDVRFKLSNVTTPSSTGNSGLYWLYIQTSTWANINNNTAIPGDIITSSSATDSTDPTISSIFTEMTSTWVNYTFATNETATWIIYVWTSSSVTTSTVASWTTTSNTTHTWWLAWLSAGTKYYYYITATDTAWNSAQTLTWNFTTDSAPSIQNASATNISTSQAQINFITNKSVTGLLYYGTNSWSMTSTAAITSSTYANWFQTHSWVLSSLTANTTYYYMISVTDAYGVSNNVQNVSFKTADYDSPLISEFSFSGITSTWVQILWHNDSTSFTADYKISTSSTLNGAWWVASTISTSWATVSMSWLAVWARYYVMVRNIKNGKTTEAPIYSFTTSTSDTGINLRSLEIKKNWGTANNLYMSGWQYRYNVTVNDATEQYLKIKIANWTGWSSATLTTSWNTLVLYPYETNPTESSVTTNWVWLGTTYSEMPSVITLVDSDPNTWWIQASFDVFVKLPVSTTSTSYSTYYSIKTNTTTTITD